jgi:DNA topoisomerase-1
MNFFRQYVGYDFTADLESQLDDVSAGEANYKDILRKFWTDFHTAISETSELRISEVLDVLDAALTPQLYPAREDGSDPRICPKCGQGSLHLKTSRTGGFVGCGNYPECTYTRPIAGEGADGDERVLGEDAGDEIWLKTGRFGPYVQRGEPTPENKKPPRASLPRGWEKDDIDLAKALTLLSLPREIGEHSDGGMIKSNFGRFGPYIMHQGPEDAKPVYVNVKDPNDVFEIGMNRAVELLAEKRANPGRRGGGAAVKPLKELGEHPADGGPVNVMEGRYGPYVKWEKVNATIPKGTEPADVTMEMAVELITERAAKSGKKKAPAKKAVPKKKPAAKKPAAKKPAAKKAAPKKKPVAKSEAE